MGSQSKRMTRPPAVGFKKGPCGLGQAPAGTAKIDSLPKQHDGLGPLCTSKRQAGAESTAAVTGIENGSAIRWQDSRWGNRPHSHQPHEETNETKFVTFHNGAAGIRALLHVHEGRRPLLARRNKEAGGEHMSTTWFGTPLESSNFRHLQLSESTACAHATEQAIDAREHRDCTLLLLIADAFGMV